MDDLIFYGGGAFAVLWIYFRNIIKNHNGQNTDGDNSANKPLPMSKPKTTKNN